MLQLRQSMRWTVVALVMAGMGWLCRGDAVAAPEPSIAPSSWELQMITNTPMVIAVYLPGETTARLYWYMTYSVTNRTGEDQLFLPDIWMATDHGDLVQANRSIPPTVFTAVKERVKNPLLESPSQVVGTLLQGPDHSRDGVAIWPVPQHDVDHARIFVAGLSGEVVFIQDPAGGPHKLLRKTLMMEYDLPGDASHASQKVFNFVAKRWILR